VILTSLEGGSHDNFADFLSRFFRETLRLELGASVVDERVIKANLDSSSEPKIRFGARLAFASVFLNRNIEVARSRATTIRRSHQSDTRASRPQGDDSDGHDDALTNMVCRCSERMIGYLRGKDYT
jgi:hypothetical protein